MKLDLKERLQLSYQLMILEKLYPDESEQYAIHRKAIEEGYELHYSWITQHLYEGLTKEQCEEVLEILEMYRGIYHSYNSLQGVKKKDIENPKVIFQGFDGNNETSQMAYTRYFIDDLGRYTEIKDNNGGYYNSHSPMLPKYRNMLIKWKQLTHHVRYNMSNEQLLELIETY